ncbi:putative tRNA pseudouridine synthase Pus10 [Nowakowskiella sp. JEL0407]|nr:putative tRNA pseudouridine synthase Pus10 [Nowakowskiella sp. JEL0407]
MLCAHCGSRFRLPALAPPASAGCVACLDAFHADFITSVAASALAAYSSPVTPVQKKRKAPVLNSAPFSGYSDFSVAIQLAPIFSLRHHCSLLHFYPSQHHTTSSSTDDSSPAPADTTQRDSIRESLKSELRSQLIPSLQSQLNLQYSPNSPLSITVSLNSSSFFPQHTKTLDSLNKFLKSPSILESLSPYIPPPPPPTPHPQFTITLTTSPLYISGKYLKTIRHISNSKWVINNTKKTHTSVEEEICHIVQQKFHADDYKFSSCGREDSDVLCLDAEKFGGRPFYVKLLNPRVFVCDAGSDEVLRLMSEVQEEVNNKGSGVVVKELKLSDKVETDRMNAASAEKSKWYRCIVRLSKPVSEEDLVRVNSLVKVDEANANADMNEGDETSSGGAIVLKQKNPTRVPRRADLERIKKILDLKLEFVEKKYVEKYLADTGMFSNAVEEIPDTRTNKKNKKQKKDDEKDAARPGIREIDYNLEILDKGQLITVDMKTSAGTYVKEFVHGDDGRTTPSLKELLGVEDAQVLCLDVTGVEFEF